MERFHVRGGRDGARLDRRRAVEVRLEGAGFDAGDDVADAGGRAGVDLVGVVERAEVDILLEIGRFAAAGAGPFFLGGPAALDCVR